MMLNHAFTKPVHAIWEHVHGLAVYFNASPQCQDAFLGLCYGIQPLINTATSMIIISSSSTKKCGGKSIIFFASPSHFINSPLASRRQKMLLYMTFSGSTTNFLVTLSYQFISPRPSLISALRLWQHELGDISDMSHATCQKAIQSLIFILYNNPTVTHSSPKPTPYFE